MKDSRPEQTPSAMPERAPQDGEVRVLWAWVESVVWTERMLATLETGIEGGKWFRLIDKVWSPKGRGRGTDHQRWPNAYFTAAGLFSLKQAHAVACRSS